MSERDQFEAWMSGNGKYNYAIEKQNGQYILATTITQWEAWQASREALKAEQVPIGEVNLGEYDDAGNHPDARVVCLHAQADWENFPEGTKLYLNPQRYPPSHNPIDTTPNQYDALGKGERK